MRSAEQLREWEERMGPEKVQRAMAIVYSHGWRKEDTPPNWVWAEAYAMVDGIIPEQWGNSMHTHSFARSEPSLQERIFGFKLF
jgi:hypothetical protein